MRARSSFLKRPPENLKRAGGCTAATTESMKTELANLSAEKETAPYGVQNRKNRKPRKYDTVKQNVDALLAVPKEQKQQRRHELE